MFLRIWRKRISCLEKGLIGIEGKEALEYLGGEYIESL
jgi:hypothetical protein